MKTFLLSCCTALLAFVGVGNYALGANNDVITQNVRVLDFSKIEINGIDAQIRYSQSDVNEVNVTTNEYLHDMLSIVVDFNTLVIKPNDKYKKKQKESHLFDNRHSIYRYSDDKKQQQFEHTVYDRDKNTGTKN